MDFLKNSFGKEKNSRSHAITMLAIYGIFIVIVVALIRNAPIKEEKKEIINNETKQDEVIDNVEKSTKKSNKKKDYDINYSYSYTIMLDGVKENYLGKKVDDKEKFSYIRDGETNEYAILNGNYLVLENGVYHITDSLNNSFKYCDTEKITTMLEDEEYVEDNSIYIFNISNAKLSYTFGDALIANNNQLNKIELELDNDILKGITLNLDNFISSVTGSSHTLNIKMEFANVGTTEDFEIKVG